ncbi:S41 family peptidase [Sinomicrobium sp. M5D2P17]
MKKLLTLLILTILLSCKKDPQWNFDTFFDQVFGLIEERSIKKDDINWTALKQTIKDSIKTFKSNDDVYRAIDYTVKLIDDGHSIFLPSSTPNPLLSDTLKIPEITSKVLDGDIGYLKLTGFLANDSISTIYTQNIRKSLMKLDKEHNLSGWIIDLRKNKGGKLSTECLGVAPLFQKSLVGIAKNNKNEFIEISCFPDAFYFGDYKMDSITSDTLLLNKNKKIAVLVGNNTASAGEFISLAFKFQDNTKVFGEKTRGMTSHLELISFMSDAKLLLASKNYCDKNKEVIHGSIEPDIKCDLKESTEKAIQWIKDAS